MDAVETIEREDFTPEPEPDGDDTAMADDDPVHLAKCAECATAVTFRPNVTGTGFLLVDADPDATFGVGPNGRPVCPNGHGEMGIADDRIPAPAAFADAQAMLLKAEAEAVQRALPGVFPAFNFEGAFKEIVEQAQRVERLKADYDDAKAEATEAKKSLDKAAELLMKMTLEFERRRKEKPETETPETAPAPAAAERTPCTWEQAHEGSTCPVCTGAISDAAVLRVMTVFEAAPDAQAHADDVDAVLDGLQVEDTVNALDAIDVYVEAATIAEWSAEDRTAVLVWANAEFDRRHDVPDVTVPERPVVLGKPHVPAEAVPGSTQVCTLCDVVLSRGTEDQPHYKPTDLIGTDCAGKPNAEPNRYPEKKKKAAKKKAGKGRR